MKARQGLWAVLAVLAAAQSCTNDFDKFDLSALGGSSSPGGKTSSSGGSSAGTAIVTGGNGGSTTTGGTTSSIGGDGGASTAGSGACDTDEKDCGGSCELLSDPTTGCAAVDCTPCALDNATEGCAGDGSCAVDQCEAGFGDCNDQDADGCEQDVASDPSRCGDCDRLCSTSNGASLECAAGLCVSTCPLGRANCTQPATGADDGCETDVGSNATECGGCGNSCVVQGLTTCSNSQCGCGTTDNVCGSGSGSQCVAGLCECDATACRPGERCRQSGGNRLCSCNGSTGASCAANEFCCEGSGCTDVLTTETSCGACGRACTPGFSCESGSCDCDSAVDCGGEDLGTAGNGGNAGNGGDGGTAGDGGAGGSPPGPPACVAGRCVCSGVTCGEGQRCLSDGSCG